MNLYFYFDSMQNPVMFDIQKAVVDIPTMPVYPLMMFQKNPPFSYLRDAANYKKDELLKNDPKKMLLEEK